MFVINDIISIEEVVARNNSKNYLDRCWKHHLLHHRMEKESTLPIKRKILI